MVWSWTTWWVQKVEETAVEVVRAWRALSRWRDRIWQGWDRAWGSGSGGRTVTEVLLPSPLVRDPRLMPMSNEAVRRLVEHWRLVEHYGRCYIAARGDWDPVGFEIGGNDMGERMANGFCIGQRVSAKGERRPGTGIRIRNGVVQVNLEGGSYRGHGHIVLVKGAIEYVSGFSRSVDAQRSVGRLEKDGVYFHVADVHSHECEPDGVVMVRSLDLAAIVERLRGIGLLLEVKEYSGTIRSRGGEILEVARILKNMSEGNDGCNGQ